MYLAIKGWRAVQTFLGCLPTLSHYFSISSCSLHQQLLVSRYKHGPLIQTHGADPVGEVCAESEDVVAKVETVTRQIRQLLTTVCQHRFSLQGLMLRLRAAISHLVEVSDADAVQPHPPSPTSPQGGTSYFQRMTTHQYSAFMWSSSAGADLDDGFVASFSRVLLLFFVSRCFWKLEMRMRFLIKRLF